MRTCPLFVLCVLVFGASALTAQTPTPCATPPAVRLVGPAACPPAQPLPACLTAELDCPSQFWVSADYLLWRVKKAPLPPVVTTGAFDPNTFVPGVTPSPGAIGTADTVFLRGGQGVGLGTFSGLQVRSGYWFDAERTVGVEAGAFLLERRSASYTARSDANGVPLLKLPFFDTFTGQEVGANAAFANDSANFFGGLAGSVNVVNTLRLWGADAAAAFNVFDNQILRVDVLVGGRYLDLDETARVTENFTPIGQPLLGSFLGNDVPVGANVTALNNFHTRNQFYGGTVGGRAYLQVFDELGVSLLGRVGLGVTQERSAVGGLSTLSIPGTPALTAPGGVYALPSNSGIRHGSNFAVVPEVNLNLHYQITSYLTATVGYSYLYWSSVVRPGDQIDHNVDQRQIPTGGAFVPGLVAPAPAPLLKRTDFWANGVNFGLALQF